MGRFFSDVVEQALVDIYYNMRTGRGKAAFQSLERACEEGDADAACLLARCLSGDQYVWNGHDFPVDSRRARELIQRSVALGSALGVLISMRLGDLTPPLESEMPFDSLQEAFDEVLDKAERGEPLCQYAVGNVYFFHDFFRIENKSFRSFPSAQEYRAYFKENILKCEGWYRKSYENGVYFAGTNLSRFYLDGDRDIVPPRPEKAKGLYRIGAQRGYPPHQFWYAEELMKLGRKQEAVQWFQKAAEGGAMDGWYHVGKAYELGEGVPKDCARAAECYEKGLLPDWGVGCYSRLGALYFDGEGVPQDYDRAFQLLKFAYDRGSEFGVFYLGAAYFYGLGVQKDYGKAREFLEKVNWTQWETCYMLGVIYGQGLGVEPDIPKAVEYLQRAGNRKDAKEELRRYRKTLFGKWVRR